MWNQINIDLISSVFQGLAAMISIFAIVPSIFLFFRNQRIQLENQREQLELARDANHRYAIERYRDFLNVCLQYPEISLESGAPKTDLDEKTHMRRDIAFDILTSTFERAYIIYIAQVDHSDQRQKTGWEDYISEYCNRPDYLEWVRRVLFNNDTNMYFKEGQSQYDTGFEKYLFGLLRQNLTELDTQGVLDRFSPTKSLTCSGII